METRNDGTTPFTGAWWRHSSYTLTDGLVRPNAGAALRAYNPWREYEEAQEARSQKTGVQTSWEQFVNISTDVEAVAWCNMHGLLGLLPHRADEIAPYPRWEFGGTFATDTDDEDVTEEAVHHVYRPTGSGWRDVLGATLAARIGHRAMGRPFQTRRRGGPKPEAYAVIRDLEACYSRRMPIADAVGRYFPDVPMKERTTHAYPLPLTKAFWASYAEPVDEILAAARLMRETTLALEPSGRGRGRPAAEEAMNSMLQPVRTRFSPFRRGTKGRLRWTWGSLLAAMALMLSEEAGGEGRILVCSRPACNRVFVNPSYQTEYCSPTCHSQVKVARWRKENPEKEKKIRERSRQRRLSAKADSGN